MAKDALSNLQNEFLREFFGRENRFYLTGGAALVGFYLGHRETNELDLFTLEIESGFAIVKDAARVLGASVEAIQTAPDFRRLLVKRGDESVVVDLVREYVFQLETEKREINGIRVVFARRNFGEQTLRSAVALGNSRFGCVRGLEKAGFNLENALSVAQQKDTGLTAAYLAWVLNQIELSDDLSPSGDVSISELKNYLDSLITRLKRLAFPE
ncbi:MAG: hypothetical protein LC768_02125 [Acidobacteria bacterium]|nr:hypothetical protein [Acidobacteriota bacterium]MCA1637129.1 hypothetical protein [Acidobacteriota bacterium]